MMKSWPLGLRQIASAIAWSSKLVVLRGAQRCPQVGRVLLAEAHEELPVQVRRTRLQLSQKLWVSGVMKPSRPPVSFTRT